MLIVLDEVDDAGRVRPFLPATADSLVLVTSRWQSVGLAAAEGILQHDRSRFRTLKRLELGRHSPRTIAGSRAAISR